MTIIRLTHCGYDGLVPSGDSKTRCHWVSADPLYIDYHDKEWGVPLRDPRALFELLCLEGAQAGLSWITVLRKREGYRKAFDNFDPHKIVRYSPARIEKLMQNADLVRNRLKIEGVVKNAKAFLAIDDFDKYLWSFVGGKPIRNQWTGAKDIPVSTPESEAMSKDLKKRGFTFCGPTICYAFMQAAGLVNDHAVTCFRYKAPR